jgi:hypothetical protein
MELDKAAVLATQFMDQHGLEGWRLGFDRAKARAGTCRPAERLISLSAPLTRLHSEEQVKDTVLHEIAHALVGAQHKHNAVWRAKALAIGCSGERCVDPEAGRPLAAWRGTCAAGHQVEQHRRPTRVATCRLCAPAFDLAHVFEWRYYGQPAPMHPSYLEELEALRSSDGQPVVVRRLGVGTQVRVTAAGRFAGAVGQVAKVGRTRYHVRVPTGMLTVPFGLVEPASD